MDQTSGAYLSTSSCQAPSSDPAARVTRATTEGASRTRAPVALAAAFGFRSLRPGGREPPPDTSNSVVPGTRKRLCRWGETTMTLSSAWADDDWQTAFYPGRVLHEDASSSAQGHREAVRDRRA